MEEGHLREGRRSATMISICVGVLLDLNGDLSAAQWYIWPWILLLFGLRETPHYTSGHHDHCPPGYRIPEVTDQHFRSLD
eukprot:16133950-Heterocapsa_arctica.AAC.1